MELFQELLFSVALSLLLSLLLARILSMASSYTDLADQKSASAKDAIKKAVKIEPENCGGLEREKIVRFVEEINLTEFEEKDFIRVDTIRPEEKLNGGVGFEENLFDESSERLKFCRTAENLIEEIFGNVKLSEIDKGLVVEEKERENLIVEIFENVMLSEIEKEFVMEERENLIMEIFDKVMLSEFEKEFVMEEKESIGEVKFVKNLVDESSEREKFCGKEIESENLVDECVKLSEFDEELVVEEKESVGGNESVEKLVDESDENVTLSETEELVMEEKAGVACDEFVENLVDESSESVTFREINIESENLIEESSENVKLSEIDKELVMEEKESVGGDESVENFVDEGSERLKFCKTEIISENLVDESPEKVKLDEIEKDLDKEDATVAKCEDIGVFDGNGSESEELHRIKIELVGTDFVEAKDDKGNESDRIKSNADDDKEEGFYDDWEGIERTELEKNFGAAMVFVASKSNADRMSKLESDVKMQLYGLHKVAIEGPCFESQPMALMVSARAKWNAWQRLGNMSREEAMEQYITLLSSSIPGWNFDDTSEGEKYFSDAAASENLPSVLTQPGDGAENEIRESQEMKPCVEACDVTGVAKLNK